MENAIIYDSHSSVIDNKSQSAKSDNFPEERKMVAKSEEAAVLNKQPLAKSLSDGDFDNS